MGNLKNSLFYLPPLYLIYHFAVSFKNHRDLIVMKSDFTQIRNEFYIFYAVLFLLLGINATKNKNYDAASVLPTLIVSLILTTFSFALAMGVARIMGWLTVT
jgi:hypothetical protein